MKLIYALIILICTWANAPTLAQADSILQMNPACIPKERIAKLAKHYPQLGSFTTRDLCSDSDAVNFRIVNALVFIEDIQLSGANSASGDDLVTPLLPDSWSRYFSGLVKRIQIEDITVDTCRTNEVLAYITNDPVNERDELHVCPLFSATASTSLNNEIQALMHEAWHLHDNKGTLHVQCTRGENKKTEQELAADPNAGKFCDESIQAHGANAISVEVLAKIAAHGVNVNPVMRDDARSLAIAKALNFFNKQPAITEEERPLLLTTEGKTEVLGSESVQFGIENVSPGLIANWYGHGFAIFAPRSQTVLTLGRSLKAYAVDAPTLDPIRSAYNALTPAVRDQVRAVHFGKYLNFIMTVSGVYATCNYSQDEIDSSFLIEKIPTRGMKLKSVIYLNGFDENAEAVTLLSETGQWADLSCHDGRSMTLSAWRNPSVKSIGKVMKIGGKLYTLSKEGFLLERSMSGGPSQWSRNTVTADTKFADFSLYHWNHYLDGE